MPSRKNFMGERPSVQEQQARRESVEALFTPRLAQRRVASQDIPIARIQSNPFQAWTTFDTAELEELAQAIRELGFTSRLRVRPHPQLEGAFQLVYGERRLRAAALAGLETVPWDIAEHTDDDLIEIGLAENIQRRDLNPIEKATAFQTFIDQRGYSIRRLAERIGKDKSYVEGRLALMRAPDDVQALVAQRPDTLDAARQLGKLPLNERQSIIAALLDGSISSREVRAFVQSVQSAPTVDSAPLEGAAPEEASAIPLAPSHESGTTTHAPSIRAERTPNPHAALVRSIQRDRQAISAILKRWQMLRTGGAAQQVVVDEALEALLVQISTMTTAVEVVEGNLWIKPQLSWRQDSCGFIHKQLLWAKKCGYWPFTTASCLWWCLFPHWSARPTYVAALRVSWPVKATIAPERSVSLLLLTSSADEPPNGRRLDFSLSSAFFSQVGADG